MVTPSNIDPKAQAQFDDALKQPFSIKGALMPDAHFGYSLPIGGVIATDQVIVPAWVGCGMCALPTTFNPKEITEKAEYILSELYKAIPVGFNVNQPQTQPPEGLTPANLAPLGQKAFTERKEFRAIGSLGGGNHFLEIGEDETNRVWIIIHSGSRGVGHGIATEYMRLASPTNKADSVRILHHVTPLINMKG